MGHMKNVGLHIHTKGGYVAKVGHHTKGGYMAKVGHHTKGGYVAKVGHQTYTTLYFRGVGGGLQNPPSQF